MRRLSLEMRN